MENKTERIQILMTPAELAEIDTWGFAHHIRSRGEVIRRLVKLGLEKAREMEREGEG
jgi:metal-responsive CopG/Arc/MetJ family transcriptional regulator